MYEEYDDLKDLNENIAALQTEVLGSLGVDDERYTKLLGDLSVLYDLRLKRLKLEIEAAEEKNKFKVNPNTLLQVGGNLLGILAILHYEQAHVVTSRAFGLLGRSK